MLLRPNFGDEKDIPIREGSQVTLGRSHDPHLSNNLSISRDHAKVFFQKGALMLLSLSSNPTWLRRKDVTPDKMEKMVKNDLLEVFPGDSVVLQRSTMPVAYRICASEELTQPVAATTSTAEVATDTRTTISLVLEEPVVVKEHDVGDEKEAKRRKQDSDDGVELQEQFLCSICCEILQKPVELPCCNALYCKTCLSSWLARSKTCPGCRKTSNIGMAKNNVPIQRIIDSFKMTCEHCGVRTTRGNLEDHLRVCQQKVTVCVDEPQQQPKKEDAALTLLKDLGVDHDKAVKALALTNNVEQAFHLLEQNDGALPTPSKASPAPTKFALPAVSSVTLEDLVGMGFEGRIAREALRHTTTLEQAVEWLLKGGSNSQSASPAVTPPSGRRGRKRDIEEEEDEDEIDTSGGGGDSDGGGGEIPMCYCGRPAVYKISRTAKNPNRPFYACRRFRKGCGYFLWEDEAEW